MKNKHFLQSELEITSPEESLFHIIPAAYEQSVSYGTGTAQGPQAIINASQQLETYDGKSFPSNKGIHTKEFLKVTGSPENVLLEIKNSVYTCASSKKIPILLGGEHTVTLGAIQGLIDNKEDFGVIQFDAHADLRDTYEGSPYSHACVMRRIHELDIPIFQIANRSYSAEEISYRKENMIPFFDAQENYDNISIPSDFPKKIYITIDIDVFDISLMPATGTPEPGGILWYQFFNIIEELASKRNIIGFDCVEFSPIKEFHAYDFLCARLIYNMMGIIDRQLIN